MASLYCSPTSGAKGGFATCRGLPSHHNNSLSLMTVSLITTTTSTDICRNSIHWQDQPIHAATFNVGNATFPAPTTTRKRSDNMVVDGSSGERDGGNNNNSVDMEHDTPVTLYFPPPTKQHILNCSISSWHPKYRTITPKTRVIELSVSGPFMQWIYADSIVLPDDDDADYDEKEDVSKNWRHLHRTIRNTIAELGGAVMPKLNWSAPKDAVHMNANTMVCHRPSEIYLLLKSSDFVSHDLYHPYDDCVNADEDISLDKSDIKYVLALRKAVPGWNPSVEFRCFVRDKKLLCISQREKGLFPFLHKMRDKILSLITDFFNIRLSDFEDDNFVFDVYIPDPYTRVWLVDINPWARWTDPLLYSWQELLEMAAPLEEEPITEDAVFRMKIDDQATLKEMRARIAGLEASEKEEEVEEVDDPYLPQLRLVEYGDPEANLMASGQYSAYKMPQEVVAAGQSAEGIAQMARDMKDLANQQAQESDDSE